MPRPRSANVARHLETRAAESPERVALIAPSGEGREPVRRTFAQLHGDVAAAAAVFAAAGMGRGTRTLLAARPGLDLIRAVFGLMWLGAVPVVLDPGLGLRGLLRCIARTQPEALVGVPPALAMRRLFSRAFAATRHAVGIGGAGFARALAAQQAAGTLPGPAPCGPEEPAAILFTSGSTGPAKGVLYRHRHFEAQVGLVRETYGIEPGEVDFPMLPVFALFNSALGMTTVVPPMNPARPARADPARLLAAMQAHGVTNSFGSPAVWRIIADHCAKTGESLPGLRRVLAAGAPVTPRLLEELRVLAPNAAIHTPYGATEALPVASIQAGTVLEETAAHTRAGAGTCVGRPLEAVDVRILRLPDEPTENGSLGEELSTGEVGEIVVAGPQVTEAYDKLPEATAKAKLRGPDGRLYHRMGDLGYFDARGRLWFCGRLVEAVRLPGGRELYTDCVEGIFNAHPSVRRCALIGLGGRGAEKPALVVEPGKQAWPGNWRKRERLASVLKAFGAERLPDVQLAAVFFQKRLPVDVRHNAKIHRLSLRRRYQHQSSGA